jgi:hypothetical protein
MRAEAKASPQEPPSGGRSAGLMKLACLTYAGFSDEFVGPDMRPPMLLMNGMCSLRLVLFLPKPGDLLHVFVLEPENREALVRQGSQHNWNPTQSVPGGPFHLVPIGTESCSAHPVEFLRFWALYAATVVRPASHKSSAFCS